MEFDSDMTNSSNLLMDITAFISSNNDSDKNNISWSLLIYNIIKIIIYIALILLQNIYQIITIKEFSIPGFIVIVILIYYGYRLLIKPINYIEGLDSPMDKRKKDFINIERRLRKIGTKLPPPFPNGWYLLLESVELKDGEIKQVDCLGENFAVHRGMDGIASVTDAYCPHLGANLTVGGTINDNCVECPFHKWSFDIKTGKCTSIPNVDTVPRGINLKVWPSAEVDGGIFVWYDIEGREPQWELPSVEKVKNGEWIYNGRNEFLVATIIQDIAENGADVAHFNSIHGDSVLSGKYLPTNSFYNILGINFWEGKWEISNDAAHVADVHLDYNLIFMKKFSLIKLNVFARQIGPSYVTLSLKGRLGSFVYLQAITPLEPFLVKVTHRLYAPWYIRPIAWFLIWGESVMFSRDAQIWNKKKYVHSPQLSKADKNIKGYRNWFQQFYSPNSIPFKDAILGPTKDLIDW